MNTTAPARTAAPAPAPGTPARRPWGQLALDNIVWLLLIAFIAIASIASPYFFSVANAQNVLLQATTLGMIALAISFALLLGCIDLSVVGILGFSGAIGAVLVADAGVPGPIAMLAVIAVGALVGLFNGWCVSRLRMNSLISTLAVGLLLQGAVLAITQGSTITIDSAAYRFLGTAGVGGWPLMVLVPVIVFAIGGLVLNRTRWGRGIFATGGNLRAARAAGIDVKRMQLTAFVTSGALAGIAGVLATAYLGGINSTVGNDNLLLYGIAAPVIGGVSLFGGVGRISGIIGGILLLTVVQVALQIVSISAFYVQVVGGAMILVAVLVDAIRVRRQAR